MKIKLINIGRSHFNGKAEVNNLEGALNEASKHLVSSDVAIAGTDTKNLFNVYAGAHKVGQVQIIEE